MHETLAYEWRKRMAARSAVLAGLLAIPVLVSALIGFSSGLGGLGAGITGFVGYKRLDLRGPTRSINSVKETIRWAKQRLLGRSAS